MSLSSMLSPEETAPLDACARVIIGEKTPLLRHALAVLVGQEPDFEVLHTVGSGVEAVDAALACHPDLVLLGLDLPGMGGLEAARVIRERCPDARIVVLTEHEEDDFLVAAVRTGVHGYLLKDIHPNDVVRALRAAMRGRSPIAPSLVSRLMEELRQSARPLSLPLQSHKPEQTLSRRELEILRLAAQGLSNKEIGLRLSITEGTVKNHVHNALRKLHMTNRIQAATYVIRHGLAQ